MSAILAAPLVVTAALASLVALAALWHPIAGGVSGALLAVGATFFAVVSADPPRRIVWWGSALATAGIAIRTLVPLPLFAVPALVPLEGMRAALAAPLAALVPEPESGILLGIVLGERSGIARELRDAFAATGTAHLLAISGFNMTLVAGAVALGLRGRVRPALVATATVAAVVAYSALVGPGASVLRAALMASVGAVGLAIGRRGAAGNALGAAVTAMLLIDPRALEDVGFLLSVSATAGLILWQRDLAERFSRLPSPLAEGLAATLAASLPTIPIVAAVFGRVSLVSPVANLVAVPLFAPILLFGAATALVGALVPWAAGAIAAAAYVSAAALRYSVELFARAPLASVDVPAVPLTGLALAALLALIARSATAAWLAVRRLMESRVSAPRWPAPHLDRVTLPRPGRGAVTVLCLAVVVASALAAQALPRSSGLRVRALDVGQGDAYLLESAGRYALIDGGPDPSRLLRELGEALPPWDRRIDLVVLTHEHADHGNGLLAVLDRYDVGLAVEPVGMSDVPLVRSWSERVARAGVRRVALGAGARLRLGRITLHVLAPGGDRRPSVANLVLLAEAPEGSVLFMGDATDDSIADLLLAPDDLAARLYVPPHHGADTSYAAALVEAVRPEAALLSVGASNRYGHPTPGTLAALAAIPVYRTDRHGTVEVELDGDRIHVRTDKTGVPSGGGGLVPRPSPAR